MVFFRKNTVAITERGLQFLAIQKSESILRENPCRIWRLAELENWKSMKLQVLFLLSLQNHYEGASTNASSRKCEAEKYIGKERFSQLKKEYMDRYISSLEKAKEIEDLYYPESTSFEPEFDRNEDLETEATKTYGNTDHYNEFVTSMTANRKKTTPLIVYQPFESRPTVGAYPASPSTPLTSITTMTSSTRTSSKSTPISKPIPSTVSSITTTTKRPKFPEISNNNETIQASAKKSSSKQLAGNILFVLLAILGAFLF
ncbi:Oidioi.mRNA.OKI2018_I69.chr2.g5577.t1.cds [Oikopleura dioica]|uniref:Oidioi.mRNA.OKI2018_I69.chr2.g5577.t1.cds n=1 Tax=Oikopleura dioica TaxID=34765 RepID=A0ABN7T2H4_OIKDI|nr:Oidioi.mRNA.OKI2018_I69.chr2.g5577.t1.cds [Oikopleura dioica]